MSKLDDFMKKYGGDAVTTAPRSSDTGAKTESPGRKIDAFMQKYGNGQAAQTSAADAADERRAQNTSADLNSQQKSADANTAENYRQNAQAALDRIDELKTEQNTGDLEKDRQIQEQIANAQKQYDNYAAEYERLTGNKLYNNFWGRLGGVLGGGGRSAVGANANAIATLHFGAKEELKNPDSMTSVAATMLPETNLAHYGIQNGEEKADERFENLKEWGDKVSDKGQAQIDNAKLGLGGVGQFAVDAGAELTKQAIDAALNIPLKGLGTANMLLRVFGSAAREAELEGKDASTQVAYGFAQAGKEYILNELLGGMTKVYGQSKLGGAVETALNKLIKNEAARAVLSRVLNTEGIEEGISAVLDAPIKAIVYGDTNALESLSEIELGEVLYSALMGQVLGTIGGGAEPGHFAKSGADANANTAAQGDLELPGDISAPPATANAPTSVSGELNLASEQTAPSAERTPFEIAMGLPSKNEKGGVTQAPNAQSPGNTPNASLASSPQSEANASMESITQVDEKGNSKLIERGFGKNVRTDANMEGVIRQDLEENREVYRRLSNKDTLAKAQGIFDRGYESAASTLQQAIGASKGGGKLSPEMVPLSRMVANEMARRGDVIGARQVIADVAAELTAAGELGQAGAILRDPLSALQAVTSILKDINSKASARIAPGTVVVARDRGNFGKVLSEENGVYRVRFTSRDGAVRVLDMTRDAFYIAKSKTKRQNAGNSAESQGGNIYVDGWAEQIGRNLADKLTQRRSANEDISVSQQMEKDVAAIIRDLAGGPLVMGPAAPKADPKLAQIERLSNVVNNAEFYNSALEQTRQFLADKYGVPRDKLNSILGEWANQSIEEITIGKINEALQKELGESAVRREWVARLTPEEEQLILNTDFTQEGAFEKIYEQIAERLGREMPSTLWEKVTELRRINMLLRPRTMIKNFTGNIPMLGVRKVSEGLSGAIQDRLVKSGKMDASEQTRTAKVSEESRSIAEEVYKEYEAELNGQSDKWDLKGAIREQRTIFKPGALEAAAHKLGGKEREQAFLESARRFTYESLQKGDAPFVKSAFVDSLAQYCQAHNITDIESVPQEAIDFAKANADEATYKAVSSLAKLMNQTKGKKGFFGPALDILFPFTTTPINITTQLLKYSPVSLGNAFRMAIQGEIGPDMADALAKGTTGSAIMGLGFLLRALGAITAGEDEDKDKAAFDKSKGIGSYSFKLGDASISYDWAQPAGSLLALGAELANGLGEDADFWTAALNSVYTAGDAVLNLSIFQNVLQILKGTGRPTEQVINAILEGGATQMIPGLLGDIAKIIDGTVRSTYTGGNVFKTSAAKVASSVPGLSAILPASVNTRGEEVSRGSLPVRAINQLLNPSTVTKGKQDEATKAIDALYEATGDKTIFPQVSPYTVDYGKGYKMTGEERERFQTTQGQTYYEALNELIKDGLWESMSEEAQIKALQQINEYAKDAAKRELVTGRGDEYVSDWDKASKLRNPDEYVAAKAAFSADLANENYKGIDTFVENFPKLDVDTQAMLTENNANLSTLTERAGEIDAKSFYRAYDKISEKRKANGDKITANERLDIILGLNLPATKERVLVEELANSKTAVTAYDAFTAAGYPGEAALYYLTASGSNKDGSMNKAEERKYIKSHYGADFSEIWAILYPSK